MPTDAWTDLDSYAALPRLGGLSLSPDGDTLLVSVQSLDAEKTSYRSALWRVDPQGEAPALRYTRSVEGEAAAAFLRDGSLVFTSKREVPKADEDGPKDSTSALWCLPAGGGEAYVLARRDGGWGQVLSSAETDTVVVGVLSHTGSADDEADAAKRDQRRKKKVSAILHSGYPVRDWDHDIGPEATRLRAASIRGGGERVLGEVRDLTGDVGRSIRGAALSRDGGTLVVEWADAQPRGEFTLRLVCFDVATGGHRTIAAHDDAEFTDPVVSDDGRFVAAIRSSMPTAESAMELKLWLVDLTNGEGRVLAGDWDRWAQPVAFSPDGRSLFVRADDDGHHPLFAVDVASGQVRRLTQEGAYSWVVRSPDGGTLYAVRSGWSHPGEVVAVDVASATTRVLPGPVEYPALPGRVERVETTAPDGQRVPGWLVLPDGASAQAPAPLTLWVHGGPRNSWNDWSWRWCPWLLAARGQAVLLPDPALSTGYGQAYIQRGWGRWGDVVYGDVMALTDTVEARGDVRDDASVMMGGSFGGYMANWIATQTDRFKAIVSHASLWNLPAFADTTDVAWFWLREANPEMAAAHSPHLHADRITTPMLVIHGDKDYRVPIGEGLALWWALVGNHDGDPADLPHRFLYFPDENHWILTPQHAILWYRCVLEFLAANREGRQMERPELL